MYLSLSPEIKNAFSSQEQQIFDEIMSLKGKTFRELENRRTQRIELKDKSYFIKQHFGVGWKEIFKNLFQLRLPVISSKNEWRALQCLHQLNIPTQEIVGYGYRGLNPASKKSFLMTRELPKFMTLEDLCRNWKTQPPPFWFKYKLIQEIARISSTIHAAGINHRDFYICHFLLDLIEYTEQSIKLILIDLHRAQIRRHVPMRWMIKDLAGLYFSSMDIGLTQRDLWRFIKFYRQESLRNILNKEPHLWKKVKNRAEKLFQKHEKKYL